MYNFLIFFISIIIRTKEKENFRLVLEIYKHGAISPKITQETEIKDIFGEKWEDKDELTSVGLRQEFLIGYINKLRYIKNNNFIKEQFDPREVLFYSLNSNKSILSSYALSQGFFPSGTGLTLNQKQILNAVPPIESRLYEGGSDGLENFALPKQISIVPTQIIYENDFIISSTNENLCEGIKKTKNKKDFWSKEMLENKNIIIQRYSESINKEIKEKDKNNLFNDYDKIKDILNTILSEYYDGRNIEKFKNKGNVTELINDIKKYLLSDYQNKNNKEIVIHSIAPFMRWIIELINIRIKKDKEGKEMELDYNLPKLILISSDDSIFKPLEFIMNICFNISIDYSDFGSYLNFELKKVNETSSGSNIKDEDYAIEYYFNGINKKKISFPEFKKKIEESIKSDNDVKKFCNFKDKTNTPIYKNLYFIISMVLIIVFIFLLILLIIKSKRTNDLDKMLTHSKNVENELVP